MGGAGEEGGVGGEVVALELIHQVRHLRRRRRERGGGGGLGHRRRRRRRGRWFESCRGMWGLVCVAGFGGGLPAVGS